MITGICNVYPVITIMINGGLVMRIELDNIIRLNDDEAEYLLFAKCVEEQKVMGLNYAGSGSTSNVMHDDEYAYKIPRVLYLEEEEDDSEYYLETELCFQSEYNILKSLSNLDSFDEPVYVTETILITKFIHGREIDECVVEELSEDVILRLAYDLVEVWNRGYIPLDLNLSNVMHDEQRDLLVVIDVGHFRKRDEYELEEQPMPIVISAICKDRAELSAILYDLFPGGDESSVALY